MVVRKVRLKDILAAKRWDVIQVRTAQAGSKTARDGYTLGWTSGGARVDITYDQTKKRYIYTVSSYAQDGSDMSLEPQKHLNEEGS